MLSNNLDDYTRLNKINTYYKCSTNCPYEIYVMIDFGKKWVSLNV
jgi:hypothetical protein